MFKTKKNSFEQKNKSINPIILNLYIYKLKREYNNITDHTLIAHLLNTDYKLSVTKEDIDEYYGYNDIIFEDFEMESRKQKFNLINI